MWKTVLAALGRFGSWLLQELLKERRKPRKGQMAGGGQEVRDDVNASVDTAIDGEDER